MPPAFRKLAAGTWKTPDHRAERPECPKNRDACRQKASDTGKTSPSYRGMRTPIPVRMRRHTGRKQPPYRQKVTAIPVKSNRYTGKKQPPYRQKVTAIPAKNGRHTGRTRPGFPSGQNSLSNIIPDFFFLVQLRLWLSALWGPGFGGNRMGLPKGPGLAGGFLHGGRPVPHPGSRSGSAAVAGMTACGLSDRPGLWRLPARGSVVSGGKPAQGSAFCLTGRVFGSSLPGGARFPAA